MTRHPNLEDLARLGAGDFRPRKADKLGQHLAACPQCTLLNDQLAAVPAMLSSVRFAEMPQSLSTQIGSVLAAEAARRVVSEPAAEAGGRDLPARSATPIGGLKARRPGFGRSAPDRPGSGRPGAGRPGSHRQRAGIPSRRLPAAATRVMATATAILIVGISGYEIAAHTGGPGHSAASGTASVRSGPFSARVSLGPQVSYRQAGTEKTIQTVSANTNFHASTLASQAATAVTAAQMDDVHSSPGPASQSLAATSSPGANRALGVPTSSASDMRLGGCIGRLVTPGEVVLLVESARFDGVRATIIVTVPAWASAATPPRDAEVWAVGAACSATNSDVLDHVRVARL